MNKEKKDIVSGNRLALHLNWNADETGLLCKSLVVTDFWCGWCWGRCTSMV